MSTCKATAGCGVPKPRSIKDTVPAPATATQSAAPAGAERGWGPGAVREDPAALIRGLEPKRQLALIGNQTPARQAVMLQALDQPERLAYLDLLSPGKRRAVIKAMIDTSSGKGDRTSAAKAEAGRLGAKARETIVVETVKASVAKAVASSPLAVPR